MAESFLGEIKIVPFNFSPNGWAFCNGQLVPINQNQSLFSILGTTYGGNGVTSFGLPDLRGRTPIHVGSSGATSHALGSNGGAETHLLDAPEMANHHHTVRAKDANGSTPIPADNVLAAALNMYADFNAANVVSLTNSVTDSGGNQAHDNVQPFLTLNFCIALQGIFPSQA